MKTFYVMQGGNPNNCPDFPFCSGNSACNSGKCPDEPVAPIDANIGLFLLIGAVVGVMFLIKRKIL